MKAYVMGEAGHEEALLGLSFSFGQDKTPDRWLKRRLDIARKLSQKQGGHNKFLESIIIWLDVTAPRYWWQQADTYRLSTKQSESTMHTVLRRPLTRDDFAGGVPDWMVRYLNELIDEKKFTELKAVLPEGFLQRRVWCMSYKTFQNMYLQRRNHKLGEWSVFLKHVLAQLAFPEYITGE